MKRTAIHIAFAAHCAGLGYSPGNVGWTRGKLHVLTDDAVPLTARMSDGLPAAGAITIHASAKAMTASELAKLLEVIPRKGDPRAMGPILSRMVAGGGRATELAVLHLIGGVICV